MEEVEEGGGSDSLTGNLLVSQRSKYCFVHGIGAL